MSPLKRVAGPSLPCLSGLVTVLSLCLPLKMESCPVPSLPEAAGAARLLHLSTEQRFPNNRLLVETSEGNYSLLCSGRSAGLLSSLWSRQGNTGHWEWDISPAILQWLQPSASPGSCWLLQASPKIPQIPCPCITHGDYYYYLLFVLFCWFSLKPRAEDLSAFENSK